MPITQQEKLPPIGTEYYCDHNDDHADGAEHAYGGGYHAVEAVIDASAMPACSNFYLVLSYNDPCTDCMKECKLKVGVDENNEAMVADSLSCSTCSGIAKYDVATQTFTAYQPGMIFDVAVMPGDAGLMPTLTATVTTQAEALGSSSDIRVGGVVVRDRSLPFYSRKTALSPTGAATEEFAGIVMHGFQLTQPDYDNCCACPSVPRCKRFCLHKEGAIVVGMAAPVEPLTTGTEWDVYYESDAASPSNSFFYILDPGSTPPATAVALPNSYVLQAEPGEARAAVYVKG